MSEVIILSDIVTPDTYGHSRYLAPYTLASSLENSGFDVTVIDYFTRNESFFAYLEKFLTENTIILGISTTFLNYQRSSSSHLSKIQELRDFHTNGALWLADDESIKRWLNQLRTMLSTKAPKCKIVLGGAKSHRILHNKETYGEIDYVCIGAGDKIVVDLANHLRHEKPLDFMQHSSFKILKGGLKSNSQDCPEAVFKPNFSIQANESLPIEISRGCAFNCKFCSYDKRKNLKKDLSVLKNEFLRNYETYGTTVYYFSDDCFNDKRDKVETFCNMFLSLPFKIEWVSYARVDLAIRFPETLDLMIQSGARGLWWGLESFNEVVARNAGKGTPIDKVKEFLIHFKRTYSQECLTSGSFIVGLPGETRESILETINWFKENPTLDFVHAGPLVISSYNEDFDKVLIDYADYARSPEKFGFQKIAFQPKPYWEHATMNSDVAESLSLSWMNKPDIGVRSIWMYPHLRTLGFTKDQIFQHSRPQESTAEFRGEVSRRFESHLHLYFNDLLKKRSFSPTSSK